MGEPHLLALFAITDPALLIALCLLMAVSSALQTATGFGFAILSAPVEAVLLDSPAAAVTTVMIVGTAVDLLILFLRRRPPQPRWDELAVLGVSSLPGLALGAYLLVVLAQQLLMVIIAAAVLAAIAFRVAPRAAAEALLVVPRHLDRVHLGYHIILDRDHTAALGAEEQLLDSDAASAGALVRGDDGERADAEPSRCRSPRGSGPGHRRVRAGSAAPAPAARKHPVPPDAVPSPTPSPEEPDIPNPRSPPTADSGGLTDIEETVARIQPVVISPLPHGHRLVSATSSPLRII